MKEIEFKYKCHSEGFRPNNRQKAFTLAEVLITLAIIGVIASITLPSMVLNIEYAVLDKQWREAYSFVSQACEKMRADNGGTLRGLSIPYCSDGGSEENTINQMKYYASFYNYKKIHTRPDSYCGHFTNILATLYEKPIGEVIKFPDGSYDQFINQTGNAIELNNGTYVFYTSGASAYADDCTSGPHKTLGGICSNFSDVSGQFWGLVIFVDTNGKKKPNMWGKDFFAIRIAENGVYPHGVRESDLSLKACDSSQYNFMNCGAWRLLYPDFKPPY